MREGNHPALRGAPVGPAHAIDHDPVPLLSVEVGLAELCELRDAEPGVEDGPDDELLLAGLAGVRQAVGLILG